MSKVWQITLTESDSLSCPAWSKCKVKIMSGQEGKTVEGTGSTASQAYSSACAKLVIKPWLENAEWAKKDKK